MPHILVAGKIHDAGLAVLKQAPGITFDLVDEITAESYLPLLPRADALLIRTQPVTAAGIATAPRLRIVSRHGVGYDAVDVAALNSRRIPLCIVGDVNSRAVAEHTLMLMLAAARRTVAHDAASRNGNWKVRNGFETTELDGKTLLILGFGRIGRRVAQLAQAFGMTVLAHDPFIGASAMGVEGVRAIADIGTVLGQIDFLTLHVPLSPKGAVIGAGELAAMKPSAIVVNAARGGLIDETALDLALRQRKLAAAALDVLVDEPPGLDHPLLANPYVTISPHSAGLTAECAARMAISSAQNILDHFAGKLDRRLVVNAAAIGM
ncbi:MAG: hydroxyacid dehydrogenase [Rhizobiales bacterium]|nr:hydroxyacid dehydrogenase [Hyphomicrobiales bacterium]MBI3672303.1 hydroxyacid dehydrogenase [Hyphomicrobiales bacterium]